MIAIVTVPQSYYNLHTSVIPQPYRFYTIIILQHTLKYIIYCLNYLGKEKKIIPKTGTESVQDKYKYIKGV